MKELILCVRHFRIVKSLSYLSEELSRWMVSFISPYIQVGLFTSPGVFVMVDSSSSQVHSFRTSFTCGVSEREAGSVSRCKDSGVAHHTFIAHAWPTRRKLLWGKINCWCRSPCNRVRETLGCWHDKRRYIEWCDWFDSSGFSSCWIWDCQYGVNRVISSG